MSNYKPCSTLARVSVKLASSIGQPLADQNGYRSTIGSMQYLSMTMPDIAFIVNKLSQFLHCPTDVHWQACKRVLRDLKGTVKIGFGHIAHQGTISYWFLIFRLGK